MLDRRRNGLAAGRRALRLPRDRSRGALSPVPRPQSPVPRAFTLIELLVVISIMVILLGLVATMMPLNKEGRRTRETARMINAYLSSARNEAIKTGHPCGVTFRNFNSTGAAMNADQCEVPPCYAGECMDSVARVVVISATTIQATLTTFSTSPTAEPIPIGMVKQGDLIQLNLQGPLYTITNDPNPGGVNVLTLVLDATHNANTLAPWTATPKAVPYRIFRSPVKGFAQPMQMPVPAVVDLTASGVGTGIITPNTADFTILFSPTGAVDSYYVGATRYIASDMIYLLVGSNERVDITGANYITNNTNVDTLTNYQDMNNRWVTINPQTGAVQTEPVASCAGAPDAATAIIAARMLAVEGVGMGGN